MPAPGLAIHSPAERSEASLLRRFKNEIPYNVGHRDDPCKSCDALHWKLERTVRTQNHQHTSYSTCCQQGAVQLPMHYFPDDPQKEIPGFYKDLLSGSDNCLSLF